MLSLSLALVITANCYLFMRQTKSGSVKLQASQNASDKFIVNVTPLSITPNQALFFSFSSFFPCEDCSLFLLFNRNNLIILSVFSHRGGYLS